MLTGLCRPRAVILACVLAGCASPPPEEQIDPAERRLRLLHGAYEAAFRRLGRPPRDAQELAEHLPRGEDVLVSPNDGEPFVVLWGVSCTPVGLASWEKTKPAGSADTSPIFAYERRGTIRGRCVARLFGETAVLPEDQFAQSWFAGRPPAPPRR